jgi:hypothetical protein
MPHTDQIQATTTNTIAAPCPVYPGLCTAAAEGDVDTNGNHYDHASRTYGVTSTAGDFAVYVEFIHPYGSTPFIGFEGDDLTPDQTRVKAQELRRLADDMDGLADQVQVARTLHRIHEARDQADGPWAEILDIVLAQIEEGALADAVVEQVLVLFAQARAARATSEA